MSSTAGKQTVRRELRYAPLALALVVVVVFGRTLAFDFCGYDDQVYVSANERVMRPSWGAFAAFWTAPYHGVYIPAGYSLYLAISAAAVALGHGTRETADPLLFHAAAVALHALATVLVFALLTRLGTSRRAAGCGAALFAVHPVQVESVAWISGLPGLLGTCLALGAMILFLDLRAATSHGRTVRGVAGGRYAAATALFVLATVAKPLVVMVPAIVGLLDVAWFRRPWQSALALLLPWLGAAFAVTCVTIGEQTDASMLLANPWPWRPVIALDALGFYLACLVWPWRLVPDYGRTPQALIAALPAQSGYIAATVLVVLGSAVLAWKTRNRAAWIVPVVFALSVAPVLGLVTFGHQDISTVADRYLYLAMLPVAWLLALVVDHRRAENARWTLVLGGCLVLLAGVSFQQQSLWRDPVTLAEGVLRTNPASWIFASIRAEQLDDDPAVAAALYQEAARRNPQSLSALHNLGKWYHNAGQFDDAFACYERALALAPGQTRIMNSVGMARAARGELVQGIEMFRRVLAADPSYVYARINLADALAATGDFSQAAREMNDAARRDQTASLYSRAALLWVQAGQPTEAEACFRAALRLDTRDPAMHAQLAQVLLQTNRTDAAVDHLRRACRLAPQRTELRINLATALLQMGRADEAERELRATLHEHPRDANAHYNLGAILSRRGQHAAAAAEFRAALDAQPTLLEARLSLAATLASLGQLAAAVAESQRALADHPDSALAHHQLALLLDQQGRRNEALAHLRKAIEIAPNYTAARQDLQRIEAGS
ncbi:MAG: tetratricopeptide repeat protein [Pirellulales bacterium]|nr:tetratricopeptide repeat protein [Pirellulales bacterium]